MRKTKKSSLSNGATHLRRLPTAGRQEDAGASPQPTTVHAGRTMSVATTLGEERALIKNLLSWSNSVLLPLAKLE